jgi:hypothetical protein
MSDGRRPLRNPRRFNSLAYTRFYQDRHALLVEQVGGSPTPAQEILITRCVALEWKLRHLDSRLTPELPVEKLRHVLASANICEQQLRLNLCALGLRPAAPIDQQMEWALDDALQDAVSGPDVEATGHAP